MRVSARAVEWQLLQVGNQRARDPAHPGGLLGLAPGRSGASVRGWLDLQSEQLRDGIKVVAVDPSVRAVRRRAARRAPATLVVDHWHLHRLANLMLTQVRQRVTQQPTGTAAARCPLNVTSVAISKPIVPAQKGIGPSRPPDAITDAAKGFNHRRLHGEIGLVPPVEHEATHGHSPPPHSEPAERGYTASSEPGT